MARLFKPTIVCYLDSQGRRCKKGDPGARKKRQKSKTWRSEYRDAGGVVRSVTLCTNKEAARHLLHELEIKAARGRAGLVDPFEEHHKRALAEHLKDFCRHLEAMGNEERGIRITVSRARTIFEGCGFKRIGDISASAVSIWLKDQRSANQFGVSTSNGYLAAAKSFCNWLVKDRRTRENPLAHLSRLNVEVDVRIERRPATPEQFPRLIEAARRGKPFRGISGPDRAMLYIVATYTGLRAGELASLTTASPDLDSEQPTVTVEASYSKRRRKDQQPIRPDLAEMLREWLSERSQRQDDESVVFPIDGTTESKPERLWPRTWHERAAEMLRIDLAVAGIDYKDESGRQLDFHALRHTFISNLAAAGVQPKRAQQLARHSDINLTMNTYTHLSLADVAGDLDRLPALLGAAGTYDAGELKATGTDDEKNVVAGMVAGVGDISCDSVRVIETEPVKEPASPQITKPLENKGIESDCQSLTPDDTSRAGRIRTCNQKTAVLML